MLKKIAISLSTIVIIVVSFTILGHEAYVQYKDLVSHAYAAQSHLLQAQSELRTAADSKDLARIGNARDEFTAAREEFAYLNRRIDSLGILYDVAELLPSGGGQAEAARRLMRAGELLSQAGEESCLAVEGLTVISKKDSGQKYTELLIAAAPVAAAHLSSALQAIDDAQAYYKDLSSDGLHPLLSKAVTEMRSQVPKQRAVLQSGYDALRILPELLGKDREQVYLVLVQDSSELRPTGGFIGNYGIIRFRGGKMVEVTFNDAYRVDWPYYYSGKAPPPLGMFARYFPESTFWALRDSNIWPDFDRSAKQAAWFAVAEGIAERVDGVIGITDDIVHPLMKIVGPIEIPEYGETVDQSNVLEKIREYQTIGPNDEQRKRIGGNAQNRKFFTSLVLKSIIERVNNLDMPGLINLVTSLRDSFRNKAVQVYFTESEPQRLVESYDLGGEMKGATGDYLWAVDMNLNAGKDNAYVKESVNYTVSLSGTTEAGAISELEITYDYRQTGKLFEATIKRGYYADYLRVYVPPGSRLLEEYETDEPVNTFWEHGKTVFGNLVKVYPGTVRKVKLRYWQPLKLWSTEGKSRYELLVQKQAGNDIRDFHVAVLLPPGTVIDDPGVFKNFGGALDYRGPLSADVNLAATFVIK